MKRIIEILREKNKPRRKQIDEKSIFYFFNRIIEKEYGIKGLEKLRPDSLKRKNLFVNARGSTWANELHMSRQEIMEKINKEIGTREIEEIKIKTV